MEQVFPKAMAGDIPVYCAHDGIVDITKLVGNPRNPNKHSKEQIKLLARIIQRYKQKDIHYNAKEKVTCF